jgi:hypothetical protein
MGVRPVAATEKRPIAPQTMLFLRRLDPRNILHWTFQIIGIVWLFYWWRHTPASGEAVLVIGVIAVIMTFNMKTLNKALWLGLVFLFAWIETQAIAKDRRDANARETAAYTLANDTAEKADKTLKIVSSLSGQQQNLTSMLSVALQNKDFESAAAIEKRMKEVQTLLAAALKENRYSGYTGQSLLDESGNVVKNLRSEAEGWKEDDYLYDGATRELIGQPRPTPMPETEKNKIQSDRAKDIVNKDTVKRTDLAKSVLELCDLRDEFLARGVPDDSQNPALFAKLKTATYSSEDLVQATIALDKLQKTFGAARNLKVTSF